MQLTAYSRRCHSLQTVIVLTAYLIAASTHGAITIDPNGGAADVTDDSSGVEVMLTNPVTDPLNLTGRLRVGSTADGQLLISDGSDVSTNDGWIAGESGSTGSATITGAGSTWDQLGNLRVGSGGVGNLDIESGGQVTNAIGYVGYRASSTGTATVTGTNSTWINNDLLMVGRAGDGTLNVEDGGTVTSVSGVLARDAGSVGQVTVTGTGSNWTNDSGLTIGQSGEGTLVVANGGTVSNTTSSLGSQTDGVGTATVTGAGSSWTTAELNVGLNGNGTLNIEDGGAMMTNSASVAQFSGSTGQATVTGADSTLEIDEALRLGFHGIGTLQILEGGALITETGPNFLDGFGSYISGDSEVTVNGPDSSWLMPNSQVAVGYLNGGKLIVENGGLVTSENKSYVGYRTDKDEPDQLGEVIVSGTSSQWIVDSDLVVGQGDELLTGLVGGHGKLSVFAGGSVSSVNGYVGKDEFASAQVVVSGVGSSWSNSGLLVVSGILTIEDGAGVSSATARINAGLGPGGVETTVTGLGTLWQNSGEMSVVHSNFVISNGGALQTTDFVLTGGLNSPSESSVTVTGPDSMLVISDSLAINSYLTIADGGTIVSARSEISGSPSHPLDVPGAVIVTGPGSSWTTDRVFVGFSEAASLSLLDSGRLDVDGIVSLYTDGTITLDGGTLVADSITHTQGGTFDFLDGVLTVTSFSGDLLQQGGTLAPGGSPGSTTVTGDYSLSAGSLEIEMFGDGGMAGTDFDFVDVTGTATLGGELLVELGSGFVPDPLDSFTVLMAGSLTGAFVNVADGARLHVIGSTGSFLVNYDGLTNEVVLSDFLTGIPGDFNSDGDVDGNDFLFWQRDPSIGSLVDWQSNYGYPASSASSVTVPEPTSCCLLTVAAVLSLTRYRKHVRSRSFR